MIPAQLVAIALGLLVSMSPRAATTECKSAQTTQEMIKCKQDQLADRERLLAALEGEIDPKLNPTQRLLLKNATLSFGSFRYSTCIAEYSLYDEGSMAPLSFASCMVAMTEWRIGNLKDLYGPLLGSRDGP